jgi:hypothetical protein
MMAAVIPDISKIFNWNHKMPSVENLTVTFCLSRVLIGFLR